MTITITWPVKIYDAVIFIEKIGEATCEEQCGVVVGTGAISICHLVAPSVINTLVKLSLSAYEHPIEITVSSAIKVESEP